MRSVHGLGFENNTSLLAVQSLKSTPVYGGPPMYHDDMKHKRDRALVPWHLTFQWGCQGETGNKPRVEEACQRCRY